MDVSPPPIFDGNEEANARVLTEFSRNSLDPREDVKDQVQTWKNNGSKPRKYPLCWVLFVYFVLSRD